jgi:hypothetical protein
VFFDILEYLGTDAGFKELCSEFHIETARASIAYRFASRWSTAGACIGSVLRSSMRVRQEGGDV